MLEDRHSITVIGAGIVGVSCALHLLRDGQRVTIVDPLSPGEACSYGNAGCLASYAVLPVSSPGILWSVPGMLLNPRGPLAIRWSYWPTLVPWLIEFVRAGRPEQMLASVRALAPLVADSLEQHRDLAREAGVEALVRAAPIVYAYPSERSLAASMQGWNFRREHGVETRVVRGDALRELEPALSKEFPCAVVIDDCGYAADPSRLVKGLAEHARRRGASLLERRVLDIAPQPDGRVRLTTDAGDMLSDKVVVAAGAWSGVFAQRLGEPVPLEAERGYHVELHSPGVTLRTVVGSPRGKFLATPMEGGLRIAGTAEFAGLDAPANYRRAEALRARARTLFPGVNVDHYSRWMGQRPSLPDSLPVIGRSRRHAGVFYAFGHQHVGLTCGPRTGRLIADLIADRRSNVDVDAYRVDRF